MSVYNYLDLLGGLAIFLLGMNLMNSNLTALAGNRLKALMTSLTRTPLRGYLTGVGVTLVNQSSSATTVLEAVLVGAGLMTFRQSLAVTLGSELGSTFLGQLFAFPRITRFATLFVALGFFGYLLAKRKRLKNVAHTVLGFGLLFLGMDMMSGSMAPLRESPGFHSLMMNVEEPLLGILIGLLFTMVVQSSGATSGLVIAMALGGAITLEQAVPLNLGASIGTCTTAILGSLNLNREAKRTAWIHLLFQTMGVFLAWVLLMVPWQGDRLYLWLARGIAGWFSGGQENLAREIAMAHTLMPILNHLLVFPLLPLLVKLFDRLMPPQPTKEGFAPRFLQETMLSQPAVALYQVKTEILRMGPIIERMLEESRLLLKERRENLVETLREDDQKIDLLRREIVLYLAKLAQGSLGEREGQLQVTYLFIASELENLADVIERNILDRARKLINKGWNLSEVGLQEIEELLDRVKRNFLEVMEALEREDPRGAEGILEREDDERALHQVFRQRHFQRLNQGFQNSLETTEIHMDLLNHLNRIQRHIHHVARALVQMAGMVPGHNQE